MSASVSTRRQALTRFSVLPPVARMLVGTQLLFNIGFFLVLPYLAGHLTGDLALAGWVVGLVLGLRTFSQQGLFLVGGTLTDRFGAKPVILAGCVVRVGGFVLLAVSGTLPGVLAGAVLTGFAGALFSPAVEASLAREAGPELRATAFALLAICGEAGAVVGPLLGALVLTDFALACWIAAGLFVLIAAGHVVLLPHRAGEHRNEPVLAGWREVLRNRVFVVFAVAYSGYLVSYNQLYLALPSELRGATGDEAALGWLFALASVMVVVGQMPTTVFARRVLGPGRAVVAGFALMAAAFGVVAVPLPGLVPAILMVVLLTAGQMLAVPFAQERVPVLAGERRLGAHFGFLSSVGGVAVLIGSTASGALLGLGPVAWLVLALVPLGSAVALAVLFAR
ncbi:MFS transporter [Kibdelosporangium persicum]|uniref:Multidrug resistance protein MdtH n=1 Tax=Kibdelosporangium persicum TaxID=2698649 RepID=A0ABX2F6V6_9PSEU|nr:MFS transporter [Kibdelosporangium persicum]NRN67089.1 Multidrug resistance protein MdtH [Kibdelosporangium persicum]